ncbi:MAG: hypothetical protein RMK94_05940 [Armatimonadota bacterium]|nr:hypothetical protein [Armatimonadota bacterium]
MYGQAQAYPISVRFCPSSQFPPNELGTYKFVINVINQWLKPMTWLNEHQKTLQQIALCQIFRTGKACPYMAHKFSAQRQPHCLLLLGL